MPAATLALLQRHTALQAHLPDAVFSQPAPESSSSLQGDGCGAGGSWRAAANFASIRRHVRAAERPLHAPRPLLGQDRRGCRQQREQERPAPPHGIQSRAVMLDPRPDRPAPPLPAAASCRALATPASGACLPSAIALQTCASHTTPLTRMPKTVQISTVLTPALLPLALRPPPGRYLS